MTNSHFPAGRSSAERAHADLTSEASARRDESEGPRYQLLFELASGGMGTVYIGRRLGAAGFQRVVAIKRMKPSIASDPRANEAFRREANIASLIQHSNVVSIHDVHQQDDELLLVMEYVEGVSLARLLRRLRSTGKRLSRAISLRVIYDTLCGLHAAHELCDHDGRPVNLVHRDATPQNILVGSDGSVRLTDFGIVQANRFTQSNDRDTKGGNKGKVAYMAPEHAFNEPLDRRADIFAIGVVLWEMLTGCRLFEKQTVRDVARDAALGKIPAPSSIEPSIPAALDAIVLTALAPWRDNRFPTAKAFAHALEKFAALEGGLPPSDAIADMLELVFGDDLRRMSSRIREALRRDAPSMASGSHIRRRRPVEYPEARSTESYRTESYRTESRRTELHCTDTSRSRSPDEDTQSGGTVDFQRPSASQIMARRAIAQTPGPAPSAKAVSVDSAVRPGDDPDQGPNGSFPLQQWLAVVLLAAVAALAAGIVLGRSSAATSSTPAAERIGVMVLTVTSEAQRESRRKH